MRELLVLLKQDLPFVYMTFGLTALICVLLFLWRREIKCHQATRAQLSRSADVEKTLLQTQEKMQHTLNLEQEKYLALHARYIQMRTQCESMKENSEQWQQFVQQAQDKLSDTFKILSKDALHNNHTAFLNLATASFEKWEYAAKSEVHKRELAVDTMMGPLRESLERVNQKMQDLEQSRQLTHQLFQEQVRSLVVSQSQLQTETANLANALRRPHVRGRWGEMQLKRVVEMAGMLEHCDFTQQTTMQTESGKQRPDMIVQLPNQKNIVVDAKTPLQSYLDAIEAQDEEARVQHLKQHARQVRTHVSQLSAKSYWESLPSTPEFVVLFLPGEPFFSAALEQDPLLIEYGVENHVMIATPTTLIALLRSIAYGWRQEQMAEHVQNISALGKTLHDRLYLLCEHFTQIRKGLDKTIESYNNAVGCFETRVLVSARKMRETKGFAGEDIASLEPCEKRPRTLNTPAPSASIEEEV